MIFHKMNLKAKNKKVISLNLELEDDFDTAKCMLFKYMRSIGLLMDEVALDNQSEADK